MQSLASHLVRVAATRPRWAEIGLSGIFGCPRKAPKTTDFRMIAVSPLH